MNSLAPQASLFEIWGFLTRKFNILVLWIVAVLLLLVWPWFLDIQEQRVWCKCKAAMHNFKINIYLELGQSCLKLHLCVNLWNEFVRMQVMCHIWGKNVDTTMVCTNHIVYLMQLPYIFFTKLSKFIRNSDNGKVLYTYIFGQSEHKRIRMHILCHIRD